MTQDRFFAFNTLIIGFSSDSHEILKCCLCDAMEKFIFAIFFTSYI